MIEVLCTDPKYFAPIGSAHVDQSTGTWYYVYDHYENEETQEFIELWLPITQR